MVFESVALTVNLSNDHRNTEDDDVGDDDSGDDSGSDDGNHDNLKRICVSS